MSNARIKKALDNSHCWHLSLPPRPVLNDSKDFEFEEGKVSKFPKLRPIKCKTKEVPFLSVKKNSNLEMDMVNYQKSHKN
jgi:hypothetical protein